MYKKMALLGCLALSTWAHAFVPQAGTWVVASEVNGAPGRGLAIDVQNDVLVMQMYAYEGSGHPTFYMANGTLQDNQLTTKLGRYVGGRHLGSGPLDGREEGSPGNITLRFTSGISGFMTLPGEGEVAISRYEFGQSRTAQAVAGTWAYATVGTSQDATALLSLTQFLGQTSNGTGLVADPVKNMACEYQIEDQGAYNLFCGQMSGNNVSWRSQIRVVGNEGEGVALNSATGEAEGMVYVRKLIDGKGQYLGLFAPNAQVAPNPVPSPPVNGGDNGGGTTPGNGLTALAICWQNAAKTEWLCDGPAQKLLTGWSLAEAQRLAGCQGGRQISLGAITLTEISENKSYSGRVYECGYKLSPSGRDVRLHWRGLSSAW